MRTYDIYIREDSRAAFRNNAAYCVGTGRMGLARNAAAHLRILPQAGENDFGYDPAIYL